MPAPPQRAKFPDVIPWIWLTGTTFLLTRLSLGLCALRRMRRAAHLMSGDVLQSNSLAAPVTWGILYPVILVPAGFEHLPEESREAVLCHERAHIRSYDFLFRLIAEITRALIWFQPLIWIVSRRLREEQELACDDRVLASGVKPSAYAKLLLDWDLTPVTPAIGMASRGSLKRRLYSVLDGDTHRGRVASTLACATWILALAAALPLAAMNWIHPARLAQIAAPQTIGRQPLAFFVARSMLVIEDVTITVRDGAQPVQGLTTGDFIVTEDGKPMKPVFAEMGRALFEQQGIVSVAIANYRIGYYPTNDKADGTVRSVQVSLKNPDVKAAYRAQYQAPNGIPTGAYEPVSLPSGTVPPALIAKFEPAYSDEARREKLSGSVSLNAVVDQTGKAVNIVVRQPLGSGLDENAIDALRKWRFRPASKSGMPVSAPIRVDMTFSAL